MKNVLQPTAQNQWTTSPSPTPEGVLAKVSRLFESVNYCALSTCSADGQPWISPVVFAFDQGLNIYWSSAIASQHSQNIYHNRGLAAIALYQSQKSTAPTDGLYLTGTAIELDLAGVQQALPFLDKRASRSTPRSPADYLGESARRMYCFSPQRAWCTGERFSKDNQLIDTKVLIELDALKAYCQKSLMPAK